jgi:hypothetical protein
MARVYAGLSHHNSANVIGITLRWCAEATFSAGLPATARAALTCGLLATRATHKGAKDRRCKELSDMLFGPCSPGRLRQSAGTFAGRLSVAVWRHPIFLP